MTGTASRIGAPDIKMNQANYTTPSAEEWQVLIAWDGDENFDPTFDNDTGFTGPQGDNLASEYHLSESVDSEQAYLLSAPPSLADGTPSIEYTISAPPSVLSSSFGQVYCTSPSFDNITTSPTEGYRNSRYSDSFDAYDNTLSPLEYPGESPILDTRYDRIPHRVPRNGSFASPTETVFNPYVAGSSYAFSGKDVRASQMLNVGTWVDQPQIIKSIAEADEYTTDADPIAIPYPHSQSFNDSITSDPWSVELDHSRSRAVSIPQSSHRPTSYNTASAQSQWAQRVPPALSVSPVSYRRPRSSTLSRSVSRTGSRRSVATPSPTSEGLAWVAYQMNTQTNRLAPTSMEGTHGRTPRGRKKGLTSEQRSHAALMRIVGACGNCQRRKEKCDPGTPCKSCLEHYKGDLVNHPCRDRVLSDQSGTFLSESLGWHPTARPLESFLVGTSFDVMSDITYNIPVYFGFGPSLTVPVHALHMDTNEPHLHDHSIYSWPPESSKVLEHTHAVLPAVLTRHAMSNLTQTLDTHLSLLVSHHFRHFPLFCSPLRILRDVYVLSRSLPSGSSHFRTLHQALKLMVLVHVGGDVALPSPSNSHSLSRLVQDTMNVPDGSTPTPCFIRSQFGSIMPGLALSLMREVLYSLEQLLLNRDCEDWPVALAVLITVLMTIESIHYHAAKLPYHNSFDTPKSSILVQDHNIDDEGVKSLLVFYTACFSGCHARLRPDWEGEATHPQQSSRPEDVFVENIRGSIKNASGAGYLSRKATEQRQGEDMEYFFDRLVARLLLLKP
jgi:hypothetical protein